MRARARAVSIVAVSVAIVTAAAIAATPTASQKFFRDALLKDSKTTNAVKRLLRTGAGFVDPSTTFADLTGDGKADAVVLVDNGGAAGALALYVFSTDGQPAREDGSSPPLRVVYRNQQLYRPVATVRSGALVLRTPIWEEGDDLCCPTKLREREYLWDAKAKTLTRRSSREVPGPGAQTPAGAEPPGAQ